MISIGLGTRETSYLKSRYPEQVQVVITLFKVEMIRKGGSRFKIIEVSEER